MIVPMKEDRDCHVAAIATACDVNYDTAKKALSHVDLLGPLESPVFSNPWNLYRALLCLGFWKRNITLSDLLEGNCKPGKTIILLHMPESPTLQQHWVVWGGISVGRHLLYWGDSETPRAVTPVKLKDYFLLGNPNCAFEVYKANALKLLCKRIELFFRRIFK